MVFQSHEIVLFWALFLCIPRQEIVSFATSHILWSNQHHQGPKSSLFNIFKAKHHSAFYLFMALYWNRVGIHLESTTVCIWLVDTANMTKHSGVDYVN